MASTKPVLTDDGGHDDEKNDMTVRQINTDYGVDLVDERLPRLIFEPRHFYGELRYIKRVLLLLLLLSWIKQIP